MWSALIGVKKLIIIPIHSAVILFGETYTVLPFEKASATYHTTFFSWLHQSRSCASVITERTAAHRRLSTSSSCWLQHRNDHSSFHCKVAVLELQTPSHPTLMLPLLTGFKWQLIAWPRWIESQGQQVENCFGFLLILFFRIILWRTGRSWKNNIKMHIKQGGWENKNFVSLIQNVVKFGTTSDSTKR